MMTAGRRKLVLVSIIPTRAGIYVLNEILATYWSQKGSQNHYILALFNFISESIVIVLLQSLKNPLDYNIPHDDH